MNEDGATRIPAVTGEIRAHAAAQQDGCGYDVDAYRPVRRDFAVRRRQCLAD